MLDPLEEILIKTIFSSNFSSDLSESFSGVLEYFQVGGEKAKLKSLSRSKILQKTVWGLYVLCYPDILCIYLINNGNLNSFVKDYF